MIKLPYLFCVPRRDKRWFYYRRCGKHIPLPAPTDPTFRAEYDRAHRSFEIGRVPSAPGSFAKIVEDYKASAIFQQKAPKTKKDYSRHLDMLSKAFGEFPVSAITRRGVLAIRDRLQTKPRTANYVLQVLSIVLNYAVDLGLIQVNPAARPKRLKTGPGHKTWTDADLAAYRDANKNDLRALLALDVGLYTGQREGDCIKMTVRHWDGQFIEVVQNKGGARVWIPADPRLRLALNELPKDRLLVLVTRTGRPYKADFFRKEFRKWADAATSKGAQQGLTFHGLRKTATVKLLEAGCSHAEVKSITGHRSDAIVSHYGRDASNKVMALKAMKKKRGWERKQAKLITAKAGGDNSDYQ
jgi:integrase